MLCYVKLSYLVHENPLEPSDGPGCALGVQWVKGYGVHAGFIAAVRYVHDHTLVPVHAHVSDHDERDSVCGNILR